MVALVLKDLLVQKKVLGLALLYVFIFSFAMHGLGEHLPLAVISGVAYMFVMYSGAWDDKCNADKLWNSLPVPKWKIVAAKYLAVLIYVAAVAALTWILFTVQPLVGIGDALPKVRLDQAAVATGIVLGMSSFYLPLYFALGYMRSRIFNILIFSGSFSAAAVLSRVLTQRPAWAELIGGSGPAVWGLAAACVVVVAGLSFLLSLQLYSRREF
ncbi:MAG TPA: ABC-2 transporter permease [Limnochordia bacterium]|nr:ABC-2 transporter permease [Limnochordia bacterium]